jgi:hypothetical protein
VVLGMCAICARCLGGIPSLAGLAKSLALVPLLAGLGGGYPWAYPYAWFSLDPQRLFPWRARMATTRCA